MKSEERNALVAACSMGSPNLPEAMGKLAEWLTSNGDQTGSAILSALNDGDFAPVGVIQFPDPRDSGAPRLDVPMFRHDKLGADFVLVFGGSYLMGWGKEEALRVEKVAEDWERRQGEFEDDDEEFDLDAALEDNLSGGSHEDSFDPSHEPMFDDSPVGGIEVMQPQRAIELRPFLVAQRTISWAQLGPLGVRAPDSYSDYDEAENSPAHLLKDELERILSLTGLRLLSEAEWEYLSRGGQSGNLSGYGDDLTYSLEGGFDLDIWRRPNRLGIKELGLFNEACADNYKRGLGHIPEDGSPALGAGPYVIRGGALECAPWQFCGEQWLLFAPFRYSSEWVGSGRREPGTPYDPSALRPAKSLA